MIPERNQIGREFSHTFLLRKDVALTLLTPRSAEVTKVKKISLADLVSTIKGSEYQQWVPHPKEYYLGVIASIQQLEK